MKLVEWLGSSKKDLKSFPPKVADEVGIALMWAQMGEKHPQTKPWKGLAGVMEIVSNCDTDTYRAVYAVNIGDVIYVLHTFQKKSKHGIATPKKDKELIEARFKEAVQKAKKKR